MFARKKETMVIGTVLAGAGLAMGLANTGIGAAGSRRAKKKQERELQKQRAASEAWYSRNYYQDYLNTVAARNALKRYRDAWGERAQEARARQAVAGGTPEQAVAVEQAGGEAMANMIGNLAAQGERNKQAVDAQKLAMDANLSQQEMAMAAAEQTAGANLMSNGVDMIAGSLTSLGGSMEGAKEAPLTGVAPGSEQAVAAGRETRINPSSYSTPISTPQKELSHSEVLKLRGYESIR